MKAHFAMDFPFFWQYNESDQTIDIAAKTKKGAAAKCAKRVKNNCR